MKAIRLVAEASPRPKRWASLLRFSYVESYWFVPRVTIRNVGDEPVGEDNVKKIEFIWSFRGEQHTIRRFEFPREIPPGKSETFGEGQRLRVKAPGHVWLVVRLWIRPGSDEPGVKDGDDKPVLVPIEGDWYTDSEDTQRYLVKTLEREADDWCSFWAASQTEVKQTLLILIATLALLANVAVSIFRR